MLGETTKAGDANMIGQWGEGGKIGALVLVRDGRGITIDSGEFRYTASIEHSDEFGKDCLMWGVRHLPKSHYNGIKVVVSGISKEMWNEYRNNFLSLRENPEEFEKGIIGSYGDLLSRPEDKGRVFVKGIFVNKDEKLTYGYNFHSAKIDRDRKMVQDFDLTYNIGWIMARALKTGRITAVQFMNMIQSGAKDMVHVQFHVQGEQAEKLAQEFTRIYGVNAVPVGDQEDMRRVGHFGLKGIIVPKVLVEILSHTEIGMVNAMRKVANVDYNACSIDGIGASEAKNVREVLELLRKSNLHAIDVEFDMEDTSLTFVDFKDPRVMGTFCQGNIKLSKSILDDKVTILHVLVEELAHEKGADGSNEHKSQIHNIYCSIITSGLKVF
jgi:hypothetical protein